MDTNDMDRHFRRTGRRWSGDTGPLHILRGEFYLPWRIALTLLIPGVICGAWLMWRSI